MNQFLLTLAFTATALTGTLRGQTFEVASIRLSPANSNDSGLTVSIAGLRTDNTSLALLIQLGYDLQPYQLTGGAGWVRDLGFDISAKYDPAEDAALPADKTRSEMKEERLRARVRNLLTERFQLKLREESKELPVYAMLIEKGGHKMKASDNANGNTEIGGNNRSGSLRGSGIPLKNLTHTLSGMLDRPVQDATGLQGPFEIDLKWMENADGTGVSIFTAMKEQLGLRLDPTKGPVKTYVIERAEKPSEN